MNKKLLATSICALALSLSTSVMAADGLKAGAKQQPAPQIQKCQCKGPCKCKEPCNCKEHARHQKPCPQFEKKMKAEFEAAIGLSAEQKAKLDARREKTAKKLEKIDARQKELAKQKMDLLKADKEFFMQTLTDEQKAKLQQFKEEKKQEFAKQKMEKQQAKKGCPVKKECKKPTKK